MYIPNSDHLPTNKLSAIFNSTTASYKFYWFLSILNFVEKGKVIIPKDDLFKEMAANAWYPATYYNLSFGAQDKLAEALVNIKNSHQLSSNFDTLKLKVFLSSQTRFEITFRFLDKYVPYKFLTPWYPKIENQKEIEILSQGFENRAPYALFKNHIEINPDWVNYLTQNNKILKEYCYWNLSAFLQVRNPNTPNIASKLIPELIRNNLTKQREEFWKPTFEEIGFVPCIYTKEKLTLEANNFALDHFVPYSFVAHDLIWNLIPTEKIFNCSKSNKLPNLETHFDEFCYLQKTAFDIYQKKNPKGKFLEEYIHIFHKSQFDPKKLKETIEPLLMIARNNGFGIM